MDGAAMMNDHCARRNRTYRRSPRIEARVTFNRVRLLGTTIQTVRQHSEQMRARNIRHGAILDRAVGQRDPDAYFIVVKTGLPERFILMPRGRGALMGRFE